MGNDVILRVEGLSKKFCLNLRRSMYYGSIDVFKSMLGLAPQNNSLRPGEFWAVDNVSLELKRGFTLGILGVNGSGKSTLLRLLNGIYQPDKGRIEVRGRTGALIALGAGFHPLMTGRENIFLNGVILGMSKKEIDRKFEEIVDFAEVGEFLDAPVKTYSSGMTVRLGFAIAIQADPDLLLVDEVLSVGDVNFQKKCFDKILDMVRDGTSIIFVSHAISAIERLCTQCLLMKNGRTLFYGNAREAVQKYFDDIHTDNLLKSSQSQVIGIGDVVFSNVLVYQEGGDKNNPNIEFGKNIIIEFDYNFLKKESIKNQLRVTIRTFEGRDIQKFIFQESTFLDNVIYPNEKIIPFKQKGTVKIKIINQKFFPQSFRLDVAIAPLDKDLHLGGIANAFVFNILHPIENKMYLEYGVMTITEFDYEVTVN
jgi:lipopolysaccharide transport system ATP-binding protein